MIVFTPAKGKDGSVIEGKKYFNFSYPLHNMADSLLRDNAPLKVQEEMPRFIGCEHIVGSSDDRKKCSGQQLLFFIF